MFKNLILYQLAPGWPATADELEQAIATEPFAPCSATQQKSTGWLPPRGLAHGALVEVVDGQWIARLAIETKTVPAKVANEKAQEKAARIEREQGRKPGRKEMRDLKDDAIMELLPHAFPRRKIITVWIDPETRIMVLDAATQSAADEVITSLVRVAGPGFGIALLHTAQSPLSAMTHWLMDESELPHAFCIERECELKASGEEPARVRFDQHNICTEEVRQHIREGKLPTRLALGWQGRVGFTLTQALHIKKVAFQEGVFESDGPKPDDEDRFDADVALYTGELKLLIADLIAALGGEG